MRTPHTPPRHGEGDFNCLHCGVHAHQTWWSVEAYSSGSSYVPIAGLSACFCTYCKRWSIWQSETKQIVYPLSAPVEHAHPDMPDESKRTYEEARGVFLSSPRAAAALLRLCVQQLLPHLGAKGKSLNDDIKSLVAQGLPPRVQQALDICRVIGNEAVHPGQIEVNDSPDVAQSLFGLINIIVEDRITRPKEVEALYGKLPSTSLKQIEKRDGKGGDQGSPGS